MFTFKTEKATGIYRAFESDSHYIKIKRKEVGQIVEYDYGWKIRLMVYKTDKIDDGNPNCLWMWIQLKARFN